MSARPDVIEEYCVFRNRSGRKQRIVEKKRATGNIIVLEQARGKKPEGMREHSWTEKKKLGVVINQ